MSNGFSAQPAEIAKLAGASTKAADAIGDLWSRTRADLLVPVAAFGDTAQSDPAHQGHEATAEAAEAAIAVLAATYERDGDRLYGAAFSYQQGDQHTATLYRKVGAADAPA